MHFKDIMRKIKHGRSIKYYKLMISLILSGKDKLVEHHLLR